MPVPDTITPSEASDSPLANEMLTPREASDAPIPPDAMLPATHQVDPTQINSYPAPAAMQEPQPTAESHLQTLGHILGNIGSHIVGDEKWTVTRDKDGNVSAERTPMTTGEKWAKIAAVALGGAARGMQAGQGPGGAGKAIGAGFQQGQQVGQEQQQAAFSEADQENRQLLFKANRASLIQDVARKTMQNKEMDAKATADEVEMSNKLAQRLAAAPGSVDAGIYQTPGEIYQIPYKHPELMKGHTDGVVEAYPIYNPDHTIKGFQAYIVDKAWADQKTKEDRMYSYWKPNPDDPVNGRPVLESRLVKAGQMTEGAYANGMMDTAKKGLDYQASYAKAQKALHPQINNWQQAQAAADAEPDPAKKAQLQQTADKLKSGEIELKKAGKKGTGSGTSESDWTAPLKATGAAQTSTPAGELPDQGAWLNQFTAPVSAEGQRILDSLPPGRANLVKRFGNYLADEGKELPRGKERGPFLDLVSAVYPNFSSAMYEARRDTLKSLTGDGKMAQSRNALNLAIQHMNEMYTHMQTIKPGEIKKWNQAHKVAAEEGLAKEEVKNAYGGYNDANEGVASEIARVFKGGVPTDAEIARYRGNADPANPASMQLGSFKTRAHMLASRMGILERQLQDSLGTPGKRYQLLTPESIATLRNLPGGEEILAAAGVRAAPAKPNAPAAPPAANTPAAPAAPPNEPNFKVAAKQPPNPPKPGMIFGTGSKGPGWYPTAQKGQ